MRTGDYTCLCHYEAAVTTSEMFMVSGNGDTQLGPIPSVLRFYNTMVGDLGKKPPKSFLGIRRNEGRKIKKV